MSKIGNESLKKTDISIFADHRIKRENIILFSLLFLMLTFLIIRSFPTDFAEAARMTDIRVGLEALYKDKNSIMIYNSRIALGFCFGNRYTAETELVSATGFSFTPDKGTYYEDVNNYPTYEKALSVCGLYESGGAVCLCEYVGTGTWKCCVTASSYNSLINSGVKDLAKDLIKKESNPYMIRISGQDTTVLVDGRQANAFPQIKALSKTDDIYALNLGSRSYRGRIEIGRYNGASTLTAVNIINIESYLLGVVTAEMDRTWHSEALKAQAVCSRSFAYMRAGFIADSNLQKPYGI
ncbi:MAG: SpoIID/LytB domain-containing protein [Lachnospiraceae bacterium]|nr:SpoIID/LytB domain-containing protein [Lachnospiraceae bacterium]